MSISSVILRKTRSQGIKRVLIDGRIYIIKKVYRELDNTHPEKKVQYINQLTQFHPKFISNPFEIYYANPAIINMRSGLPAPRLYGVVCGGDWDKMNVPDYVPYNEATPIEQTIPYNELRAYIESENTKPLFKHFKEHIERDSSRPWGHNSLADFTERLNEIDELYQSMASNGYLSQRELMTEDSDVYIKNNEPVPPTLNEVTVDIGRDGEVLHAGFGSHRLSLAKILEVKRIPVIVAARHSHWGQKDITEINGVTKTAPGVHS